jgi:hypothetical protein
MTTGRKNESDGKETLQETGKEKKIWNISGINLCIYDQRVNLPVPPYGRVPGSG